MKLQMQEIAQAIGVSIPTDCEICDVSTDSRSITPGSVFIAVRGERFDGHDFVEQALSAGAAYAIVEQERNYPGDRVLRVKSTLEAYLAIGALYRSKFTPKMIGVTGSVGKTSTKEMIYAVLSERYRTLKTLGNLNNEIGFPKMLLMLDASHEAAVLEMGMSGFGEIAALTRAARPDIGVITNIGVSHIGLLGSRENIRKAKLEILEGMRKGSPLILCGDNDLLRDYRNADYRIIRYGIDNRETDVYADAIRTEGTDTCFTIHADGKSYAARVPALGRHNVYNALAAFAVGICCGMTPEQCVQGMQRFETTGMRQNFVSHHGFTVVEDCYNASPDSMRAAIDTLAAASGRKVLIIADMLELGSYADALHYDVGQYAAQRGIDRLLCFGEHAARYTAGAQEHGMRDAAHFPNREALFDALKTLVAPGDVLWLKGSHSMHLEELVQRIYREL